MKLACGHVCAELGRKAHPIVGRDIPCAGGPELYKNLVKGEPERKTGSQ